MMLLAINGRGRSPRLLKVLSSHRIFLFIFGNVPFDEIVTNADRRRLYTTDTVVDDDQFLRNIQEGIGLIFSQDFLKAIIIFFTLGLIEGTASLLQHLVGFRVFIGNKVKLFRRGFTGMPYVIGIRIEWNRPTQNHRVKAPLIDEIRHKSRPFHNTYFHGYANFFELPLNDFGAFPPDLVSLVGDEFKSKWFPVLVENAVAIGVFAHDAQITGRGRIVHGLDGDFDSWQEVVELGPRGFVETAFQRSYFQTLTHIAVTTLWVLPVIAAGWWPRVAFMAASGVLFHLLSQASYYDWVLKRPGIDGGP